MKYDGLGQGGSDGGSDKGSDSGHILKVEWIEFADRLVVGGERKKESKMVTNCLARATGVKYRGEN